VALALASLSCLVPASFPLCCIQSAFTFPFSCVAAVCVSCSAAWTEERVLLASQVRPFSLFDFGFSTHPSWLDTVRVRPFSEREAALIVPENTSQPFLGDGSLSATPTHATLLNAHRSSSGGALRRIVRVLDDRVLVFDPPETNPVTSYQRQILGPSVKKVKDIRFCFDRVFDETASQEEVYRNSASSLVGSVLQGFNATVFAYGVSHRNYLLSLDRATYWTMLSGDWMWQNSHHFGLCDPARHRLSSYEGPVRPDKVKGGGDDCRHLKCAHPTFLIVFVSY
jgi:hypothetical protein